MTQEEKLEEAKRLYKDATANQRYVLEQLFPELKESEYEKMVNFITNELACIRATDEKGTCRHEELTKAIAWLEKQNKNAYNKELSKLLHKVICRYVNDPDIPYSDREKVSMKVLPYVERLEKQDEHKPSISVTEFDTEVERFCKECFITDIDEKDNVFCIARHFTDWQKNRQKQAWSEDDEHRIKAIIYFLDIAKKHYASTVEIDVCIDWLKSLKSQNRL